MHEQIFDGLSAGLSSFAQGLNCSGIRSKVYVYGCEQKMALQIERFAFDSLAQDTDRPRDILIDNTVEGLLCRHLLLLRDHRNAGLVAFKEPGKTAQLIQKCPPAQFISFIQNGSPSPLPNYPGQAIAVPDS